MRLRQAQTKPRPRMTPGNPVVKRDGRERRREMETKTQGDLTYAAAADARKRDSWREWPNGLGADLGGWEILFPITPRQPYRANWYYQRAVAMYGEGIDLDDALNNAVLI